MNLARSRFLTGLKNFLIRLYRRLYPEPMPRYHYLVLVCVVSGIAIGFATHLLDMLLHFVSHTLRSYFLYPGGPNYSLLVLPIIGILLTTVYVHKIVRIPLSHGCDRVKRYLKGKNYALPPRLMWSSIIASSTTLGFGGSAGAEGPSAFTGAAIGSNIGRLFKLDDDQMRLIIGIGAGAGIAGIFRSPIGGVLFSLEVIGIPLTTLPTMALIVATLCAGLTSYLLAGSQFDVDFAASVMPNIHDFPYAIILGIVCGLYSGYYSYVLHHTGKRLEAIPNMWVRALSSGLMLAVAVFIFPTLYATGYDSLGQLLNGNPQILLQFSIFDAMPGYPMLYVMLALGVIVAKAFACAATNYGGGVAGNFAPTLFAGGFLGFIFATLFNQWFGLALHVPNYVFLGMAGAMSGIIQAPLMAIFLTAEMANHAEFLWPLSVVSLLSWSTRKFIEPRIKIIDKIY